MMTIVSSSVQAIIFPHQNWLPLIIFSYCIPDSKFHDEINIYSYMMGTFTLPPFIYYVNVSPIYMISFGTILQKTYRRSI
jgi:hypothetical protein